MSQCVLKEVTASGEGSKPLGPCWEEGVEPRGSCGISLRGGALSGAWKGGRREPGGQRGEGEKRCTRSTNSSS